MPAPAHFQSITSSGNTSTRGFAKVCPSSHHCMIKCVVWSESSSGPRAHLVPLSTSSPSATRSVLREPLPKATALCDPIAVPSARSHAAPVSEPILECAACVTGRHITHTCPARGGARPASEPAKLAAAHAPACSPAERVIGHLVQNATAAPATLDDPNTRALGLSDFLHVSQDLVDSAAPSCPFALALTPPSQFQDTRAATTNSSPCSVATADTFDQVAAENSACPICKYVPKRPQEVGWGFSMTRHFQSHKGRILCELCGIPHTSARSHARYCRREFVPGLALLLSQLSIFFRKGKADLPLPTSKEPSNAGDLAQEESPDLEAQTLKRKSTDAVVSPQFT
jgi:hypothetical protein